MTQDPIRVPDYLEHIIQAIQRIHRYTEDMTEVTFLENELVQDAVIRNIEIIGEAAQKYRAQRSGICGSARRDTVGSNLCNAESCSAWLFQSGFGNCLENNPSRSTRISDRNWPVASCIYGAWKIMQ